MPGRKKSHSEQWWTSGAKPGVRRCSVMKPSGDQCRRVAEPGSVVCDNHGGLAPQVQRRAKERLAVVSESIVEQMLAWLYDPAVPLALKVKIATDVLDRAGVDKTAKIVVGVDPVENLFRDLLDRDDALEPERDQFALPTGRDVDYDGPDEDGIYTGPIVGGDEFWDGPAPEPEHEVIDADVIEPPASDAVDVVDTPQWLLDALRNGRTG